MTKEKRRSFPLISKNTGRKDNIFWKLYRPEIPTFPKRSFLRSKQPVSTWKKKSYFCKKIRYTVGTRTGLREKEADWPFPPHKRHTVQFHEQLTNWYEENKRDLPWRRTRDPYRIWLSESILQQTRVAQGLPYYERFIMRFPSVEALATASEDEVLKSWQGLGYYSRARNLHKAARILAAECGGEFPRSYDFIRALPGVGDYTAAAIVSFAFDMAYPVVDGNVIRFMCRLHGIFEEATSSACKKQISSILQKEIVLSRPGLFNQAVMEFGALACTPLSPLCKREPPQAELFPGFPARNSPGRPGSHTRLESGPKGGALCPFAGICHAFRHDVVSQLPVKKKKEALPLQELHYLLIADSEGIWVRKRGYDDLWRGMFDLPTLPERHSGLESNKSLETGSGRGSRSKKRGSGASGLSAFQGTGYLAENLGATQEGLRFLKHYTQTLSHRRLSIFFYELDARSALAKQVLATEQGCQKIAYQEIGNLAVPKNIEKFFADFESRFQGG